VKEITAGHSKKEKKNPWKEFDFFCSRIASPYTCHHLGKEKKRKKKTKLLIFSF
jgi:hypothetical protein